MTLEERIAAYLVLPDGRSVVQELADARASALLEVARLSTELGKSAVTVADLNSKIVTLNSQIVVLNDRLAKLTAPTFVPDLANRQFVATFPTPGPLRTAAGDGLSNDGVWMVQQKAPGRASVVSIGRDGPTGLRLHTEPGDNNVAGSGEMERNDVYLTQPGGAPIVFNEGEEQWWALSVRFPDDFVFPTWHRYALAGFHHTGSTGQGNFTLGFTRGALTTDPGILGFQGYGGTQDSGRFGGVAIANPIQKNVWYDFVYHVRWSSGADGFFDAWVNGKRVLAHLGPTLYVGQGAYLKLANYHNPLCDPYPACIGSDPPSSVIYDRVIRGSTPQSVALGPLE